MVTLLWTVLVLAFAYLWLRGNWFAWLVIWGSTSFIYLLFTHVPNAPYEGFPFGTLVVTGLLTAVPMIVRIALAFTA